MPPDSATWLNGSWPIETEIAASQLEITDIWGRALFSAWGGKPPGEPIRVQRPGEKQPPKKKRGLTDPAEIRRALGLPAEPEPSAAKDGDEQEGKPDISFDGSNEGANDDTGAEQEPPGA